MMNEINKEELIANMTENLTVLRAKLQMTQVELAGKVGISRQTLMNIENKRRPMTWNIFVALLCVFREDNNTKSLLDYFSIYTPELRKFMTTPERDVMR